MLFDCTNSDSIQCSKFEMAQQKCTAESGRLLSPDLAGTGRLSENRQTNAEVIA